MNFFLHLPWALLCFILFPLPVAWTFYHSRGRQPKLEDLIDGLCLSYALCFCVLYVLSVVRVDLYFPVWGVGLLAALVFRLRAPAKAAPFGWDWRARYLTAALVIYFGVRLIPALVQKIPQGWDPYFHLVLVDRILETGRLIHDWMPYEAIPLNYPLGSHLFLALLSQASAIPAHKAFQLATIVFTTLTAAQVFSLVSRSTKKPELALYAAASFAFLAIMGSLGYYFWGGLPNLISMYFFLGLLSTLQVATLSPRRSGVVFAVLFLAACLVHHHVMVTASATLGWLWVYAKRVSKDEVLARRIFFGLALSALLGLAYFGPYLLKSAGLGKTGLGEFTEDGKSLNGLVNDFGYVFFFAGVCGFFLFRRFKDKYPLSIVFSQAMIGMLFLFLFTEVFCRLLALLFLHRNFAPFTPSRFLTDDVGLLSVFPAVFWLEMREILGASPRQVLAVILLCFAFNLPAYNTSLINKYPDAFFEACDWIRHHTDPRAVFLNQEFAATYFSGRLAPEFPIPTSEYVALAVNRAQVRAVVEGKLQPSELGRPVVALAEASGPYANGRTLWTHPLGLRVVEIVSGEASKSPKQ